MLSLIILGILALVALMIIVCIHELGHFFAAKKSGVKVEEFGIGFPPRIKAIKRGETTYSLNWLPLGGFVRLHGELLGERPEEPKRAFQNAKAWKKVFIALAGVFMNFVLAILCFAIVYSIIPAQREVPLGHVEILSVDANTPAQTAGIIVGDIIKSVNKTIVTTSDEFKQIVDENKGKKIQIVITRNADGITEDKTFTVTPRENPPAGQGSLGVGITSIKTEEYYPPLWQRPLLGFEQSIKQTMAFTGLVFGGFGQIASDASQGQVPEGLCGPLCIIAVSAQQLRTGFVDFLGFVGLISLNLAILNLLPFPPLDGSRVLFVLLEKIVGKRRLPRIESWSYTIGFVLLMGLAIVITSREIPKLIQAGSLNGFVESLVPKQE